MHEKYMEKYMDMALELARKGCGHTNPNPLVGAVVVVGGRIVGQGYHKKAGGPHGEIIALQEAGDKAKGSTLYVNLEPCSHYGRTPPCVDAVIQAGVKKVVIAMEDPNPLVSGRGIRLLKDNGIQVVEGILEEQAKKLNEIFIRYITGKKPFVIMKAASSLDGKIATRTGDSKWITGEDARHYAHHIRHRVAAVMVGVNTVINDNPQLTVRTGQADAKNPIRIVVDSRGRIPLQSKVLAPTEASGTSAGSTSAGTSAGTSTIVAVTPSAPRDKVEELKKLADVIVVDAKNGRVDLSMLMDELYKREIDSILLEGGGELNAAALEENIVDKAMFFISPLIIGGKEGISSVGGQGAAFMKQALRLKDVTYRFFHKDILIEGYVRG